MSVDVCECVLVMCVSGCVLVDVCQWMCVSGCVSVDVC